MPAPDLAALLPPDQLERLRALDAGADARPTAATTFGDAGAPPSPHRPWDYDVALAGGGLSLLLAPLLARRGLRVLVLERARRALPHREWNASAGELAVLVRLGLCSQAELDTLVVARYRDGICRWHGGGTHRVHSVLDWAVDAHALWQLARRRAEEAGVTLRDGVAVLDEAGHRGGVRLRIAPSVEAGRAASSTGDRGAAETLWVGALLDGRGASSPYARTDLVCPTVGGVLTGLEVGDGPLQVDPGVGEILVTTEGVEDGRQHLWEAFPGRPGETTVYLFYYAMRTQLPPRPLEALFARFSATLGRYKRGAWRMQRPAFGLIPGWSRLGPGPTSPHPRIVLVGDAAARQSPLTFCGFGAMLRSLEPGVQATVDAVAGRRPGLGVDDQPIHTATGALALMLAHAQARGVDDTNALLDAAFATLAQMGQGPFAALLQDAMPADDAVRFLWRVGRRHPDVWPAVLRQLGPARALQWSWRMRRHLSALLQAAPAAAPSADA